MANNENERFEAGEANAHDNQDNKDQRSLANRLEAAQRDEEARDQDTPEVAALKEDPTAPARMHGNEPSRGAKIDAQIQQEEQEELERKGKA